jgi:hypothetical protein
MSNAEATARMGRVVDFENYMHAENAPGAWSCGGAAEQQHSSQLKGSKNEVVL